MYVTHVRLRSVSYTYFCDFLSYSDENCSMLEKGQNILLIFLTVRRVDINMNDVVI